MHDGSRQNPKALLFHLEWGRNGPCEMTMQVLQFWTRLDISVRISISSAGLAVSNEKVFSEGYANGEHENGFENHMFYPIMQRYIIRGGGCCGKFRSRV